MRENYALSPAVNKVSVPPPLPPVLPLHWEGLGVVYLRFERSSFPEHQHRSIQVSIPFSASSFEARWRTAAGGFRSKRLGTGDACVIPAEQPHTIWWEQETELVAFELNPEFVASAARESLTGDRVEIVEHYGAKDPMIRQLGNSLRQEFYEGFPFGRIYLESLANVLAVHLVRHYSAAGRTAARLHRGGLTGHKLRRAVKFIAEHLEEDLTLAEIAGAVGMSPYHFARQLKRSTGLAPHQYLIERRIERAKELLTTTKLPLVEIAHAAGFHSQSYFTTLFRRHTGVTPKAFREGV